MTDETTDARLRALLAPPQEFPDAWFAERVRRAVIADERMRGARKAAWNKFGAELFGTAGVVLAFLLMGRLPSQQHALAAVLLLGLWVAVALRPGTVRE